MLVVQVGACGGRGERQGHVEGHRAPGRRQRHVRTLGPFVYIKYILYIIDLVCVYPCVFSCVYIEWVCMDILESAPLVNLSLPKPFPKVRQDGV